MKFESSDTLKEKVISHLKKRERIIEEEVKFVFSPYRISPIGAHIDHQGGPVLGMTIDAYTILAYIPINESKVRIYSTNYPGVVEFNLDKIGAPSKKDWGRYPRGAATSLYNHRKIKNGFVGALTGSLPSAGLSSSASVGLAYLLAFAICNELKLSPKEFVELDRQIENDYLGLQNGILDQSTIVYGKRDHLVEIDTVNSKVLVLKKPDNSENFKILIAYSGLTRELTDSGFNKRVEECKKASMLLGMMSNIKSANQFSDIPADTYKKHINKLPKELKKRADHYFSEVERVKMGIKAWQKGDWNEFGDIMNESNRSSLVNYESGSDELKALQEIISNTNGVYGSRFSGGGYGGCVVGFVSEKLGENEIETIKSRYLNLYPQAKYTAAFFIASTDDGLRNL